MLVEQPHGLGRVEHRAPADGHDEVRPGPLQQVEPSAHHLLVRLRHHLGEHPYLLGPQPHPYLVHGSAFLGRLVGDDDGHLRVDIAQVVEGSGVEVGARRHAEPLGRRPPAGDGLDVQQVAIVDVVRGARAAPRAAAERQRGGQRVVDAPERADRGRRVDQDPAGPQDPRIAVDHPVVRGVDRGRVPEAAVLGHERAHLDGVLLGRRPDQAEHRHQLLVDEGVAAERSEIGGQRCEQHLGRRIDLEASPAGELRSGQADGFELHLVLIAEREIPPAERPASW